MKPGRELDALVAEKVMGWVKISFVGEETAGGRKGFGLNPKHHRGPRTCIPAYSTDIAEAWAVLEKFPDVQRLEKRWPGEEPPGWWCEVGVDNGSSSAIADTAPLAICLAALEAVGSEV